MGQIQNAINKGLGLAATGAGVAASGSQVAAKNMTKDIVNQLTKQDKSGLESAMAEYSKLSKKNRKVSNKDIYNLATNGLPADVDEEMWTKALSNVYVKRTGISRFQLGVKGIVDRISGKENK